MILALDGWTVVPSPAGAGPGMGHAQHPFFTTALTYNKRALDGFPRQFGCTTKATWKWGTFRNSTTAAVPSNPSTCASAASSWQNCDRPCASATWCSRRLVEPARTAFWTTCATIPRTDSRWCRSTCSRLLPCPRCTAGSILASRCWNSKRRTTFFGTDCCPSSWTFGARSRQNPGSVTLPDRPGIEVKPDAEFIRRHEIAC